MKRRRLSCWMLGLLFAGTAPASADMLALINDESEANGLAWSRTEVASES